MAIGPWHASNRTVAALLAYGVTVIVSASSAPLGLYQTYAERYHFSDAVTTSLAACSVLGVIAAVVFAGRLSDAIGRRAVLVPALGLTVISLVCLLVADSIALLFVGRFFAGLSVGTYTGAATAALAELEPHRDTRRAARVAAMAAVAGFASGPVIGGVFVEYGPWPLRLVYVAFLALLVPAFLGALSMQETVVRRGSWSLRPRRLRVPPHGGRMFALASVIALCAWGLTSMFQSLGPSIVIRLLDVQNRAAATVLVACFLGSSSIVQIRLRHWPTRRATLLGLALLPVGGLLVTLSVVEQSLTAFVAGSVIGGVGQGLAYLGGQSLVESVAPASIRGEVFSTYLIVVYLSGGVPAVLLGLVAKATGLYSSTVGYTILIAALALSVLALCARLLGREPVRLPDEPPPVAV